MSHIIHFLYKHFLKPILFLFNPTLIHEIFIKTGAFLGKYEFTRALTRILCNTKKINETGNIFAIGNVKTQSKIGLSAGFDYNGNLTQILPEIGFGFATIGTITNLPYGGNPSPMLVRLPKSSSILVNKGLKNAGADAIIQKLEKLNFTIPIGVSIGSTNKKYGSLEDQIEDIITCFKKFENSHGQHYYYELNISCPNLQAENNGVFYNPENLEKLLQALQKLKILRPIWAKMPITQTKENLFVLTDLLLKYGIKTLVMGNLENDRTSLEKTEQEKVRNLRGNLSGKPTHEKALNACKVLKEKYCDKVSLIGVGGIDSYQKAKEFLKYCEGIELITGLIFEGPTLVNEINREI